MPGLHFQLLGTSFSLASVFIFSCQGLGAPVHDASLKDWIQREWGGGGGGWRDGAMAVHCCLGIFIYFLHTFVHMMVMAVCELKISLSESFFN